MTRRSILKAAALSVGAATAAHPALAQSLPEVRWRLASAYPKSLDTIYGGAVYVSQQVAAATGGRFQISVHAGGELVPGGQVIDAVQAGGVEAGQTATSFAFGKDATFAFATALPFGPTARQQAAWMYYGDGLKLMREFMQGYGIVCFPAGNTTAQMGGFYRKEIRTVADLKGLRFRVAGLAGMVLAKLGVVPQQIAPGDIYAALEKGVIDAAEFVGPYDDEKLGLNKVAKYYYTPGFWEGGAEVDMVVGAKAWEALAREYQAIFSTACTAASLDMMAKYDAQNTAAMKRLLASGVQLRAFAPEIMSAAQKAATELYQEIAAKNANFAKVYQSWSKFHQDQVAWHAVVENRYENFMSGASGRTRK
jgi:TRAP-type mannitol/chloroaromatic compound transport system substrate-binding protein